MAVCQPPRWARQALGFWGGCAEQWRKAERTLGRGLIGGGLGQPMGVFPFVQSNCEKTRRHVASGSMGWAIHMSCKSGGVPVRMPNKVLAGEQGVPHTMPRDEPDLGCKPSLSEKVKALDEGALRVWVAAARSP